MDNPLVSIVTLAYNHELYIAKTIESVLAQKVDFPIEYIIAEDASEDNTYSICKTYAEKYPHIIRLVRSERNQGMVLNEQKARKLCRGKYIAECEGDDYWIDPLKLQKQVGFLEEHEDYGFVGSYCIIDDKGTCIKELSKIPAIEESEDFQLCGNVFSDAKWGPVTRTCTLVYRKSLIDGYANDIIGDVVLETVLARQSYYACYKSFASAYRTGVGVSAVRHDLGKALRYNEYIVRSRLKQKELFPEDCNWNEGELRDSTTYLKLRNSIETFRYEEAKAYKSTLETDLYRNKYYAKRLNGFVSFIILHLVIKMKK